VARQDGNKVQFGTAVPGSPQNHRKGPHEMTDQNARYVLDNVNILVIEDNKHMANLVVEILHALGVKNTCQAGDAAMAFQELKHFSADLIIVDWYMEPLDGLEFVRLLRTAKDSPNPYVPIIMLSGFTEYRRITEARDAGINEFLAKPISAKSIYQRVAAIIDNPRPFIRLKSFFGPDRRRQNMGPPRDVSERRKDESANTAPDEARTAA
jgi:two-component system chemotaxis response regulator CheY